MKSLKSCILLIAALTAASGFMGCDQKSNMLAAVTVTPADQKMVKGTTQLFIANGIFENGMSLLWSQVVSWSSSSTGVASIDNTAGLNGLVTANNYGTTVITAFDVANNITGTATVTVVDPDPVLTILPTRPYLAVGTAYPFSAIALFSGGSVTQTISSFATWNSSSSEVATVGNGLISSGSITGLVTAGTVTGTTIIQAIEPISGATGTTTVTVTSGPFTFIAIEQVNASISNGTTTQFTAIGSFADGQTTKTLTPDVDASWNWTSSNIGIATIDFYTGLATAVYPGSTLITAKDPITGAAGSTTLYVR
jgi:trimeric autotransporter adhesin